jgi:hypothetical protein
MKKIFIELLYWIGCFIIFLAKTIKLTVNLILHKLAQYQNFCNEHRIVP